MIAWLALAGALASVDVSSAALTSGEQRALEHQVLQWILVLQRPKLGALDALPEASDFSRSEKPARVWSMLEKSVDGALWMLPDKQPLDDTLAVCAEARGAQQGGEQLVRVVFGNATKLSLPELRNRVSSY